VEGLSGITLESSAKHDIENDMKLIKFMRWQNGQQLLNIKSNLFSDKQRFPCYKYNNKLNIYLLEYYFNIRKIFYKDCRLFVMTKYTFIYSDNGNYIFISYIFQRKLIPLI
jgi:CMP-N-acetylneuraminic acid synthetase